MANKKISDLVETTTLADDNLLEVVNSAESKKVTFKNLIASTGLKFITVLKDINLDILQDNQQVLFNRIGGISYLGGSPTDPDVNLKTSHISLATTMRMEGVQVISTDPTIAKQSKEYMTVGNVARAMESMKAVLEAPREEYELIGNNPNMKMTVETSGHAAQMQVEDKETNRLVATMEWHKATQTFNFVLFDRNSGVIKNSLNILPDGTAKINNKLVTTGIPTAPTSDGEYKLKIASGVATWVSI